MEFIDFLADKKQLQKIAKQTPTLSKKYVNVKQSEIQKLFVLDAYLKTKPTDEELIKMKQVLEDFALYKELHQTLVEIDNAKKADYLDEIKKGRVMNVIEMLWISRPQTFAEYIKAQILSEIDRPAMIRFEGNIMVPLKVTVAEKIKCDLMAQYLQAYPDVTKEQFDEMLCAKGLADFRKLIKDYRESDYVEELRDHGGSYLSMRIHSNRQTKKSSKKLDDILNKI